MNEKDDTELISVIVPVYMVEDYLDECLESIVCQTYENIEIILIVEENSTDKSAEISRGWCERDGRIVYSKAKVRGLGAARNQGIAESHGNYVAFIDSDDWVKADYIETLYLAIRENHADMAECDFMRLRNYSEKGFISKSSEIMGRPLDRFNKLVLGQVTMWRIMTKREVWLKNGIFQPNTVAEDVMTYPLLLVYANKITGVSECLYYYRKDRKGNLCSQSGNYVESICVLENIVREFKNREIYGLYRKELMAYFRRWFSRFLSPMLHLTDEKKYLRSRKMGLEIYSRCFEGEMLSSELLWGSYNLTRIVNKLNLLEDPYSRFQFSSMIAVLPHKREVHSIVHKNGYRKFMMEREFSNSFFCILKEQKPEYFFFDLLEERHDIICTNLGYYTKSDAYDAAVVGISDYRVISRNSNECTELWKKSCKCFMDCVLEVVEAEKVYMVENYLAEEYSDGTTVERFNNIGEIQKLNSILSIYYAHIRENYPEINCIEAYKVDEYYTDNDYEYGCYPWHLNEWANIRIAEKIQKKQRLVSQR